jgi:hypothetical protein
MSCKLHFFTGVNILICVASSGFILVIKVLSAKLISAAISLHLILDAPHLKKLPIDCQHTCYLKNINDVKGMFIL